PASRVRGFVPHKFVPHKADPKAMPPGRVVVRVALSVSAELKSFSALAVFHVIAAPYPRIWLVRVPRAARNASGVLHVDIAAIGIQVCGWVVDAAACVYRRIAHVEGLTHRCASG